MKLPHHPLAPKKKVSTDTGCRSAIVTGGCGGIGYCIARELASRGYDIIIVDNTPEQKINSVGRSLALKYGVGIYPCALDLTRQDLTEALESFCASGGLDPEILVNNAGVFSFNTIDETTESRAEIFMQLHVRATTLLSRWFARRRGDRGGRILNMSSMSCWMPMPGLSLYCATKAYIRAFSRSIHYDLKDRGLTVTVACPGGIATTLFGLPPKLRKLAVRIMVLDTPQSFARKVVEKTLKGKKQYINGWLNRLSIFFVGVTPTPVRMMAKHQLLDKGIRKP